MKIQNIKESLNGKEGLNDSLINSNIEYVADMYSIDYDNTEDALKALISDLAKSDKSLSVLGEGADDLVDMYSDGYGSTKEALIELMKYILGAFENSSNIIRKLSNMTESLNNPDEELEAEFNLQTRDAESWGLEEEDEEWKEILNHDGEHCTAVLSVEGDLDDKNSNYYDLTFDDGFELDAVSGVELEFKDSDEDDDDFEDDEEYESDEKYTLVGVNGNAYAIMGYVTRALRNEGMGELVDQYHKEATSSDYNHLLLTSMIFLDFANKGNYKTELDI